MIRPVQAFLASLIVFLIVPALAQDSSVLNSTGTIRGTVIDIKTSQPLAGARVELFGRGPVGSKSAMSAADGAFVFREVVPGRYRVNASHEGYSSGSREMGAGRYSGPMIAVGAGQTIDDVVIRLAPAGVIAGRITNDREEPMPKIFVQAMKRSYHGGELALSNAKSAFTDDDGEFRITGIAPGQYCVKAIKPRGEEKKSGNSHVYIPVFYPDVVDPSQAQSVELHPGEELGGIKFTLTPVHAVHVKGRVFTFEKKAAGGANVTLSQFGSNGYVIEAETNGTGNFDIEDVPAGSYAVEAQWSRNEESSNILTGRAVLSVGDADLVVPDVVVFPGATISGHVVAEGDRKITMPRFASLVSLTSGAGSAGSAPLQPDGSFVFHDVMEGNYRLQVSPVPSGYYLPSETEANNVVVSQGHAGPVEVRLELGAGQIQGVLYEDTEKQVPAASATVVLVPDSRQRNNSTDYRMATSDRSGRFLIGSIPPGEYSVLAFEGMDRDRYTSPDTLREYEGAAQSIRIEKGSRLDLQLPLTVASEN